MKLGTAFLRSKIARRFFLLFISCALLPMVALTVLSFKQVTRQLTEQSHRRLQNESKAYGMSVYERLLLLDADLEAFSHVQVAGQPGDAREYFGERIIKRFQSITLYDKTTGYTPIIGKLNAPPELTPAEWRNLRNDKTVLRAQPLANQQARLFMVKPILTGLKGEGFLFAEVLSSYVWGIGIEDLLPSQTELFVLDMAKKVLVSSHPLPEGMRKMVALQQNGDVSRQFEYSHNRNIYLASYWSIFLKSHFFAQTWTVVLAQSKKDILLPLAEFNKIFPLVVLLSLWIVLLLSIVFIKKTLAPVDILKEGTFRVAKRDFSSPVNVESGDEFEDLALSFNSMSNQLDRQFKTMRTRGEIDRAILSSLDSGKVINTALIRMYDFFECDSISFSLINPLQKNTARHFIVKDHQQSKPTLETINISSAESRQLSENPDYLLLEDPTTVPEFLASLQKKDFRSFLMLPVFLRETLAGFITLGSRRKYAQDEEKILQIRHLTDQLAVALSNARLVEDMEHLTLGTIEALARTVDAKSPWTSGHSERVADMAINIARVMGRTEKEIETLHRGGLLHDIGKIGISVAILDKAGSLNDEEYARIKEHPAIGARILEPISAYADVIPVVVQHHERYDGSGYPLGLAGEDIDINARIVSVADVHDALVSSRPYRQGWIEDRAVKLLKEESGRKFDPKVVDAFFGILATKGMKV